ncbi:hypothetical protein HN935_03865 [archaeon]|jgi:hypothetical protein|nr:hypothetical protein [archaeon]
MKKQMKNTEGQSGSEPTSRGVVANPASVEELIEAHSKALIQTVLAGAECFTNKSDVDFFHRRDLPGVLDNYRAIRDAYSGEDKIPDCCDSIINDVMCNLPLGKYGSLL